MKKKKEKHRYKLMEILGVRGRHWIRGPTNQRHVGDGRLRWLLHLRSLGHGGNGSHMAEGHQQAHAHHHELGHGFLGIFFGFLISRTHWDSRLVSLWFLIKLPISGGPQTEVSFAELLGEHCDPSFLCAVYKRFWPKAHVLPKRAIDPEREREREREPAIRNGKALSIFFLPLPLGAVNQFAVCWPLAKRDRVAGRDSKRFEIFSKN